MSRSTTPTADEMLIRAAKLSGIEARGAVTIRDGSRAIFELPNAIVACIGSPNSYETARRELLISQWLNRSGIPTVQAAPGIPQPTVVDERPVTWWELIPDHRSSTPPHSLDAANGRMVGRRDPGEQYAIGQSAEGARAPRQLRVTAVDDPEIVQVPQPPTAQDVSVPGGEQIQ